MERKIVSESASLSEPGKESEIQSFLKSSETIKWVKTKLLSPEDFMEVDIKSKYGEAKKKRYLLKSGWRKIKTFFKISHEVLQFDRVREDNRIVYICRVKAFLPSGVSSESVGVCSSDEPGRKTSSEHVIAAMAQTRALNRAIADLVGVGEFEEDIEVEETTSTIYDKSAKQVQTPQIESRTYQPTRQEILSKIFAWIKKKEDNGVPRSETFFKMKSAIGKQRESISLKELQDSDLMRILKIIEEEEKDVEKDIFEDEVY